MLKALFWVAVGILFIDYLLVKGGSRQNEE